MIYVILTIILIAIGLFISSFFFNDKLQSIEEQIEQFSIATMQDTYQLKKKVKILEEELLTNEPIVHSMNQTEQTTNFVTEELQNKPLLVQKIHHLHEQGFSLEDIAKETNLNNHDVQTILKHQM